LRVNVSVFVPHPYVIGLVIVSVQCVYIYIYIYLQHCLVIHRVIQILHISEIIKYYYTSVEPDKSNAIASIWCLLHLFVRCIQHMDSGRCCAML